MSELYIVATPIGNLGDISPRAVEVLRGVDLIAAEDTRHSKRLLSHLGITTPLQSYHEHNEREKTEALLTMLREGKSVALISDAGTPLISDPGYRLVKAAHDATIKVVPIPGASALVAALSASGLASDRFIFEGFLPAKHHARCERLDMLVEESRTLIFYESSHRIVASVTDMVQQFGGQRPATIARELTKKFETIKTAPLSVLLDWLAADPDQQRGEFVVMVQGKQKAAVNEVSADALHTLKTLLAELPVKQAASLAAKITGGRKNELYQLALELNAVSKGGE